MQPALGAVVNLRPPMDAPPNTPGLTNADDAPFSNFIIGVVSPTGEAATVIAGQMASDTPQFAAAVQQTGHQEGITTVGSVNGSTQYRARVIPQPDSGDALVAVLPMTDVNAAMTRLISMLVLSGIGFALALSWAYAWIERLGLRPIVRVTEVARAITAGDRTRRVALAAAGTEAAQLGQAMNVMLDERDASDERLRQFMADASHELRTPLTSLRGYLDLYQQGAFRESPQLDDMMRRLTAEATRMGGLVNDMLVLASLDEERPVQRSSVDLRQLILDAAQDARAIQPDRNVTVQISGGELTIEADHGLLAQLLGILVTNALAHTPSDATISLLADRIGDQISLVVADTGPGMDQEMTSHVFDRFWRGSTGRERQNSASAGLGLSIARSIVEQHRGRITVETAPGEGSRFLICLPT